MTALASSNEAVFGSQQNAVTGFLLLIGKAACQHQETTGNVHIYGMDNAMSSGTVDY